MLFVDPQEWEVTADQPGYDDEAKKNESDGADRSSALGDLFPVRALIHQLQRKKSSQLFCFALTRTLVSGRSVITSAKIRKIAFEDGGSRHLFSESPQLCAFAGFLAATLAEWAKVSQAPDGALNKGYEHRAVLDPNRLKQRCRWRPRA